METLKIIAFNKVASVNYGIEREHYPICNAVLIKFFFLISGKSIIVLNDLNMVLKELKYNSYISTFRVLTDSLFFFFLTSDPHIRIFLQNSFQAQYPFILNHIYDTVKWWDNAYWKI